MTVKNELQTCYSSPSTVEKPSWQSRCDIDLTHPFYFDHPLDHVPGIMLIVELLGLIRRVTRQTPGYSDVADHTWIRTSFLFTRFCELDLETELRAWPALNPGQWTFIAGQTQFPACVGTAHFLNISPPQLRMRASAYSTKPPRATISGHLVHRTRPENILLGQILHENGGPLRCAVLSPGTDSQLFAMLGGAVRTPEEIIEAARQAAVMLMIYAFGWPADVKLTLNDIIADLPMSVDRDTELELRWWPQKAKGNKARMRFELVAEPDNPELIGTVDICMQAWSGEQWQRIRARQRQELEPEKELDDSR